MTTLRLKTAVVSVSAVLFGPSARTEVRGSDVIASTVEVARIDGSRMSCAFDGATGSIVHLECPERVALPIDEVRFMRFKRLPGRASARTEVRGSSGDVELFPAAGGRVHARLKPRSRDEASPQDDTDESIVVDIAFGADVRIPLSALAGIWMGHRDAMTHSTVPDPGKARALFDEALAGRLAGKDVLVTQRDGEVSTIRGSVVALGSTGGRIRLNGKERSFGLDRVVGVVFATGLPDDERWPVFVQMADATEFAGRLLDADAAAMRFQTSFGAEVTVALDALSRLRFESARVVQVSTLHPAREESSGLLHEPVAARFNRNVGNGPLIVDGIRFDKGLGVHARSRLEYEVSGAYQTLAAVIGIDDAVGPRGSAVFRVEGDGRALYDSGPITGRDKPKDIAVDVAGVSTIALIVDYGADLDLSDYANWCDARLIKPRDVESER